MDWRNVVEDSVQKSMKLASCLWRTNGLGEYGLGITEACQDSELGLARSRISWGDAGLMRAMCVLCALFSLLVDKPM